MEKQLDNLAEEALAQTAAGGPSLEGRRIGNPSYGIGNPPYGSCCRPNPDVGSMACHGEITPVGHANGNAGCPATQPYMNMQVASTDPGRRTLILSHCVVGQAAGKQGPPFSARRRRRTEKGLPTNTSPQRLPCRSGRSCR